MQTEEIDGRRAPRKVLRCNAQLFMRGQSPRKARTMDISLSGMSVMADENVPPGRMIGMSFEFPVNGVPRRVEAVMRVVYSICVGTLGFRIGLQFGEMDSQSRATVSQLTV